MVGYQNTLQIQERESDTVATQGMVGYQNQQAEDALAAANCSDSGNGRLPKPKRPRLYSRNIL